MVRMRNHVILLLIGLLLFALLMLSLRGCNDQNTPDWAMLGAHKQADALSNRGEAAGDKAASAAVPLEKADITVVSPEMPQPTTDTNEQTSAKPSAIPASPVVTTFAATEAPKSTSASTSKEIDAEKVTPDIATATLPIPSPSVTPVPPPTPASAAPLPKDTAVMAADTAELGEGAEMFPRELYRAKPHMRGEDVKKVQEALKDRGFNVGPLDGIFGTKTQQAVMTYQTFHGICGEGDAGFGHVDQVTWDWLF